MFDRLHLKRPVFLQLVSDLQGHSRSLPLLPFDRPHDLIIVFHCKYISILHRFRDINTYLPKNKTSRDVDHAHLRDSLSSQDKYFSGQPVHKIWRFYLQKFQRNFRRRKILKWIMWPGPRLFQGWSVVRRLALDIACKHTKFDVPEIFHGVWNSRMRHVALTTPT